MCIRDRSSAKAKEAKQKTGGQPTPAGRSPKEPGDGCWPPARCPPQGGPRSAAGGAARLRPL
eukprot:8935586-Lingulodinium_polyedra.AAC.1